MKDSAIAFFNDVSANVSLRQHALLCFAFE